MKVLIYIVCYNAAKHIRKVLERVPVEYRNRPDIRVLISDDCSPDGTARHALLACAELGYTNYEVTRTRVNQGYGGNQKIGYNYACAKGFDYVILLHGDGQYAPEELPKFFALLASAPDVVLGSRMLIKRDALRGGMPYYKFASNIVLTKLQNMLANTGLSEFHTGYRTYSTRLLRQIPFELNSNDFDFDTDILLQALFLEKDIREFPIATFYGDETCHVNAVRYGLDILKTSLKFRMQKLGIGSSLKFRESKRSVYAGKFGFPFSSHYFLLKEIELGQPKRVLEIGSGAGHLSVVLKDRGIDLVGIDLVAPQRDHYSRFYRANVEDFDFSELQGQPFDMVCLMDILEHLREPEKLLLKLRNNPLCENARFVISVPNIAFFTVRIGLLFGRFNYADRGILDIDHKRLFTFSSVTSLLRECGFRTERTISVPPPFHLLIGQAGARVLTAAFNILNRIFPSLFSFQIIKIAEPVPTSTVVINKLLERFEPALHADR